MRRIPANVFLGFWSRGKNAGIFLFSLFFCASILHAQSSGYVLSKTNLVATSSSPQTVTYQWVASNNTSAGENFSILENIPSHETLQSIVLEKPLASALAVSPALPLSGPALFTIGPFFIAAQSSVTFQVAMTEGVSSIQNQSLTRETYALVSQSQILGTGGLVKGNGRGLVQSVAAVPNLSRAGQPVDFSVDLEVPAQLHLILYDLTGERVYDVQVQGTMGPNQLVWNLVNNAQQKIATGLYVYVLQAFGNGTQETMTGKVAVVR